MSLKDQTIQLDEYKVVVTVLLAVFLISSGFLYVQNKEYQRLTEQAELSMTSARQDAQKAEATVGKQNNTIEELTQKVETLEEENNELSEESSEYIVSARYQGLTDNDTANVQITNYGEESTNITGTCQGRKRDVDQYQSLEFEIDNFLSQTRGQVTVEPNMDYPIQNLVNINCRIQECSGNCKIGSNIVN